MEGRSYRDKLVGECTGVFEKVFDVENVTEMETTSDDEANEDLPGEATMHLSGGRKGKIRACFGTFSAHTVIPLLWLMMENTTN